MQIDAADRERVGCRPDLGFAVAFTSSLVPPAFAAKRNRAESAIDVPGLSARSGAGNQRRTVPFWSASRTS